MMPATSPKNLRKFLKSDDPALIRMGLSMAKGVGVPDEMLIEILWMYMFHDDKTIRAAAKSTFIKLAPKDVKQVVKQKWSASYRTDSIGNGLRLGKLGKALCLTSLGVIEDASSDNDNLRKFLESDDPAIRRMGLSMAKGSGVPEALYRNVFRLSLWDPEEENREPAEEIVKEIGLENIPEFPIVVWLIKALRDKDPIVRQDAVEALGIIGDKRATEPLIKALRNKDEIVRDYAVKALETFGDERAVEPLIKLLASRSKSRAVAAKALGTFGDVRAIEPLIKALKYSDSWYYSEALNSSFNVRRNAAEVLVQFGEPAMDPLLAKLEDNDVSDFAAEILEKLGKSVVKPLIKVLNEGSSKARNAAVEALGNIGDKDAVKPLITVLGDKDSAIRFSAVEALGKIGDQRAVKPLIATIGDKDSSVSLSAAEALASNAWIKKVNDEICRSLIEAFEEDWLLAGLVLWSGCHTSEILYQSVSEKLSVSPNEIVFNHWKDVSVRQSIRSRSGFNRVGGGVLEICKRSTRCRGDENIVSPLFSTYGFGRKCKRTMVRGDLRLAHSYTDSWDHKNTEYYCASCVSTYIDIQKRYDVMEKWWPQGLKAAQIANKRQIEEQAKEQAEKEKKTELAKKKKEKMKTLGPSTYLSDIFLKSSDAEMKRLGSTIKETGVSEEMLPTILRLYLWDDDSSVRSAARSVFFSNASKTRQEIVKKNWKVKYRTMTFTFYGVKSDAIAQLAKAIGDRRRGLRPAEYNCAEAALYPILKSMEQDGSASWFSSYNYDNYALIPAVTANLKLIKKGAKAVKIRGGRIFTRFLTASSPMYYPKGISWRELSGENVTVKTIELVACAALYAACKLEGVKVTLAEISEHSRYSKEEISETYKIMKKLRRNREYNPLVK